MGPSGEEVLRAFAVKTRARFDGERERERERERGFFFFSSLKGSDSIPDGGANHQVPLPSHLPYWELEGCFTISSENFREQWYGAKLAKCICRQLNSTIIE